MMPPMNVRYVGILQVANLAEMKARSDAQIDMARTNDVPTTLKRAPRAIYKQIIKALTTTPNTLCHEMVRKHRNAL